MTAPYHGMHDDHKKASNRLAQKDTSGVHSPIAPRDTTNLKSSIDSTRTAAKDANSDAGFNRYVLGNDKGADKLELKSDSLYRAVEDKEQKLINARKTLQNNDINKLKNSPTPADHTRTKKP